MRPTLPILCTLLTLPVHASAWALEPESATHFQDAIRPVLVEHCSACHDPDDPDNHVNFLSGTDVDDVATRRSLWESVAAQLRNRTMPPQDEPQPSEENRLRIAQWIDETLRATACQQGEYAGVTVARRLNRHEYDNTVRDLIGIDTDYSDTFPADGGGGEGFDNNGETLFLPPLLMERYLEAAQDILDAAIVTPPLQQTFLPADFISKEQAKGTGPWLLDGGDEVSCVVNVYIPGDIVVDIDARAAGKAKSRLVLAVDGIAAHRFDVAKAREPLQTTVRLSRGLHALTLRVPKDADGVRVARVELNQQRDEPSEEKRQRHARIFGKKPGANFSDERAAAGGILEKFVPRAFRRPVGEEEIDRLMTLYDRGAERGDPFEERVKLALKAVLVSPHFLFRIEEEHAGSGMHPVNDYELATRLSYFLWSSMPDEELTQLASEGRLHETDVLKEQVARMLADEKAEMSVENFIGQWLGTREVGNRVVPETSLFKSVYSAELGGYMRREAVLLMLHIVRENRNVLELLTADYTFLNEELAEHYEIEGVKGNEFQKVVLEDGHRGGVLGLGAVHMLTSYPNRTSPVLRGAWVLETLLGTPVPSPPPEVPELKLGKKDKEASTIREKLAMHRDNPACAACHDLMDPLGFGLENFDLLGRWRGKEGGQPVDATGVLPSGESFNGARELKQILLSKKDQFVRQLCEKMLGYALGRSLVDADQCTVQRLHERLKQDDYQVQSLYESVVLSVPFRYRNGTETELAGKEPRVAEPHE